ncbi:MAG: hypothetical protein IKN15_12115, partial [Bacteroidaceae bacterium]|nr:hypothetical protein [Bacteroidaceae bacterium]
MKAIIILIILFIGVDSAYAQKFKVSTDTIVLPKLDYLYQNIITEVVMYHQHWYLLAHLKDESQHLIALDGRGNILKDIKVPKFIHSDRDVVQCMFVRNDSLILKRNEDYIHDSNERDLYEYGMLLGKEPKSFPEDMHDFYLDTIGWTIRDKVISDDLFYEDSRYKVYSFFTNSGFCMFKDKQTGLRHVYRATARRILKLGRRYYLFGRWKIWEIRRPKQAKTYGGERYTQMERSGYPIPHVLFTIDKSIDILNAFIYRKQIFLITKSDEGICLTSYKDGQTKLLMQLCAGSYRTIEHPTMIGN